MPLSCIGIVGPQEMCSSSSGDEQCTIVIASGPRAGWKSYVLLPSLENRPAEGGSFLDRRSDNALILPQTEGFDLPWCTAP